MSIFDDVNQGRPAGLRLFINRFEPTRDFAARINDDPPRQTISFYVGVGGNGKTALLRHFQDRCCYRLPEDQWREVWSYGEEFFAEALSRAPGGHRVPAAFLDLGAQPSGVNRPQEAFSALFMLKRQLSRSGIGTPRFDFAAIAYLHKSGADVEAAVKELFPEPELAAAAAIADAFLNLPVFQVGLALYERVRGSMDNLLDQRRIRRAVPPAVVEEVLSLVPEPDLMDALPRFFADDLRAALESEIRGRRIVLLFDTYEAFAGESKTVRAVRVTDAGGVRWFRSLLGHLPLAAGVVAVVAGRARPDWSEAVTDAIPERYLETTALGALPAEYAERYLVEAGIDDQPLRSALTAYAAVEPGLVHPLLLGLAADVALAAGRQSRPLDPSELRTTGEILTRERALAARLLSRVSPDMEESIVAVAAARSFDRNLFTHLGQAMGFPASTADYRWLTGFSFVTSYRRLPAEGAPPDEPAQRYTVHSLLRRALERIAVDLSNQAHRILADYYRSAPAYDEFTRRVEEIYHRARLDQAIGAALWRDEMDAALSVSRFDRARSLITLLSDLEMPTEGDAEAATYRVARAEVALGRWDQAERLLASLPEDAPHALQLRAELAFVRGDFENAEQYSARALDGAGEQEQSLFLYWTAVLRLFLGRFAEGKRVCLEGLALASGDANDAARWHDLLAEMEFFSGDVEAAKVQLRLAQNRLDGLPREHWDRAVEARIKVDEAVVAEAEGRGLDARGGHTEVLRISREIADVRSAAHALNGLGLAAVQLREPDEAVARFSEAAAAARDLGEELLYAKVMRGLAEAYVLAGRLDDAERFAGEALSRSS